MNPPFAAFRLRIVFVLLAVAASVLGCVGMRTYLLSRPEFARSPLDVLYYVLQLFVLDPTPLDGTAPLPWTLEVARFVAPAVTIYALFEAARLMLAGEIRRIRAREARRHAVICGESPMTRGLVERLRAAGRDVVVITSTPVTLLDDPRVLHVVGDARNPAVLKAAGVARAEVLYACEQDSSTNTGIALAAHGVRRAAPGPLAAYVLIPDPDLCTALRARRLGVADPPGLRLDFFNRDELAARVLLDRDPVGECLPIMIFGLDGFGHALLIGLARRWRLRSPQPQPRLPVTVVDADADAALATMRRRYDFIDSALDLTAVHPSRLDAEGYRFPGVPQRVYVCYPDEDLALKTALTTLRLWTGTPRSLVIRVERQGMFDQAFQGVSLLENLAGLLQVFAVTDEAGDPRLIAEDLIEQLARAIHENYVYDCLQNGDSLETNDSLLPWPELPETLKKANRSQAQDIGRKLKAVGAVLASRVNPELGFTFTDAEIERLAAMEHRRWMDERAEEGWTHGPSRDTVRKRHPDMEDWARLPESSKEKDRNVIRHLPAVLAMAGFQIVRMEGSPQETAPHR
ncbi:MULTISPECIES: RyR domain-containing protein [Streptosporangium]|uniref:Voltage-gated potassium channel Kch n=1 Tax=Streptosporangium brasiliense TaxID=47480 RepID=A0ABT9RLT6_9ACTN|nr:RyR domain-containing protein [Streptosporangium brasiliense]MDP9870249.1 voltage-gated potassium channel Kch [Streptosporangium brasiliense]